MAKTTESAPETDIFSLPDIKLSDQYGRKYRSLVFNNLLKAKKLKPKYAESESNKIRGRES